MVMLKNTSAPAIDLGASVQQQSAVLKTNKSDYSPTDTALIMGTGFTPGATYTLLIASVNNYSFSTTVVADGAGNIIYAYQLDGTYRPTYTVQALDGSGTVIASTTFTDGPTGNESANLDQCANKGTVCDSSDPSQWVNGNLGQSKATYYEGDSVPYRLRFDNLSTTGSNTVTIAWDTTKSGKHALDYITTFNRTVTTADPCSGITGCGTGAFAATTYPIPTDPNVSGAGVTQIPGVFTFYGATITAVSVYNLSSNRTSCDGLGSYSGDSTTCISITFTPSVTNPVLAWGGHIATRVDWGANNSAVNIPGSPYHTRLIDLDGKGGNQDESLSANAVIYPASITIIKDANPQGSTSFPFSASPSPLTNFSLVDDGTSANTQVFSNITNFTTYTITENTPAGWTLNGIVCGVTSPNGGTQTVKGATVTINLAEGENVTCTYTNTAQTGSLTVNKQVDTNGDGTYNGGNTEANSLGFTWSLDGSGTNSMGTTLSNIDIGSHSVNENLNSQPYQFTGWYTTGSTQYSCTNPEGITLPIDVNISNNNNTNITICNKRDMGTIQVKKIVDPADSSLWDFTISGNTNNTATLGNGQSSSVFTSETGNYTVSETGHTGTTTSNYNSSYVCTDASGTVVSGTGISTSPFNLTTGENVFCTFTNTIKSGTVTVTKYHDLNANGTQDLGELNLQGWTIHLGTQSAVTDINGHATFTVLPGNYTLGEDLQSNWFQSNISCAPAGTYNSGSGTYSLTVSPASNVTCSIGNYQNGNVIVKKVVTDPSGNPVTDTTNFAFSLNSGSTFNVAGGSQSTSMPVKPGTSNVVETPNSNYTFDGCTSNGSNSTGISYGVSFGVDSQQTVTVTCTNRQKQATITVKKVVLDANGNPTSDPTTFTVNLNGTNSDSSLSETHNVVYNVNPGGPFTISETGVDTSKYTSLGCTPSGFNLTSKQSITVTCTNQQVGGTISGYKYNSTGTSPIAGWLINLYSCTSSGTNCTTFVANTLTNSLGFYSFTDLITGFYQVVENLLSTYTPVGATYHNVTINPGTTSTDNNFYNFKNINITVCKQDGNGNPISGWEMTLYVDSVASGSAEQTGSNGCYTFANLGPGYDYSVTEESRIGWTPLTSTTHGFGVAQDGVDQSYTFINFQNGSISGYKFDDINGNGTWDSGEPGLSGWTIQLENSSGTVLATTTTDTSGAYSFTNLGPGTYRLREVLQPGWVKISANPSDITLTSGQSVTNVDFGNQGQGSITVNKLVDRNASGSFTDLNPADFNWNLDGAGSYAMGTTQSNIPAGTHDVNENVVPNYHFVGWYNNSGTGNCTKPDGTTLPASISVSAGSSTTITLCNQIDYGDFIVNKITDPSTDTTTQFTIIASGSGTILNPTSNSQPITGGSFVDYTVTPGTYSASEAAVAGWDMTDNTCQNVSVSAEETVNCYITNTERGNVIVTKYNDVLGTGVFEPSDPTLSGWTMNLASSSGGMSQVTDASGIATFSNIVPTFYTLTEDQQSGWSLTDISCASVDEEPDSQSSLTSYLLYVPPGQTIYCTVLNHNLIPILTITKANDAVGNKSPGDIVDYTITITATQSAAQNVTVTDLLPDGFHYNSGSWKALLNGNPVSVPEPTYHSPGVWTLGNMGIGDTYTLTYSATIDNSQATGTYYDEAWGQGYSLSGSQVLANAENPGDLNVSDPTNNFVGTDVAVVSNYAPGT